MDAGDDLIMRVERKVLYKDITKLSAKISIPRWWVGNAEFVVLDVYNDKIIVRRKEE